MTELDKMPPIPPPDPLRRFTPTEKRLLAALSDGEAHRIVDLIACLPDELSEVQVVRNHIFNIRKKLPKGEYIVCEINHYKSYYRHVILLSSRNGHSPTSQPNSSESVSSSPQTSPESGN